MMKERQILFNGEMVRAILEGRKMVTRRPVKGPQIPKEDPSQGETRHRWSAVGQRHARYGFCVFGETEDECAMELGEFGSCPYGRPGDRLWVREAWSIDMVAAQSTDKGYDSEYELRYRADEAVREIQVAPGEPDPYIALYDSQRGDWRPSIHMPRWASRILLEVTAVRVERLQDITESMAVTEGAEPCDVTHVTEEELVLLDAPLKEDGYPYRNGFALLWNSTGGDWDANPWVWVVEFKRVEAAAT